MYSFLSCIPFCVYVVVLKSLIQEAHRGRKHAIRLEVALGAKKYIQRKGESL